MNTNSFPSKKNVQIFFPSDEEILKEIIFIWIEMDDKPFYFPGGENIREKCLYCQKS